MSYARFGAGSDVYVFLSVGGYLECCSCAMQNAPNDPHVFEAETTEAMLEHLRQHRAAGHQVPEDCIERLKAEAEANDHWIATGEDRVLDD